jgi:hypothetical protein
VAYTLTVYLLFCANLWRAIHTTRMASPDSIHYFGRALILAGYSREDAFALANGMSQMYGWDHISIYWLVDWNLVRPRVMFPLLASPLVAAQGWFGLILAGICVGLVLFALMAAVLRWRYGAGPALFAMLAVFGAQSWFYYAVAPLTEGLSALLLALGLGAVWLYRRSKSRGRWLWLAAAGLAMAAFAFTRQAQLIPAGALFAAWLGEWARTRRARNSYLAPAGVVVGVCAATQLWQMLAFPFDQLSQMRSRMGGATAWETVAAAPRRLAYTIWVDLQTAAKTDPGLVFAMVLTLAALFVAWRRVEAHLALGALAGGLVYQAVNGSTRLEFRYFEPGLFIYALALAALAAQLGSRLAARPPARAQGGLAAVSDKVAPCTGA